MFTSVMHVVKVDKVLCEGQLVLVGISVSVAPQQALCHVNPCVACSVACVLNSELD